MECTLCDPKVGPVLARSQYWRLILNHNQNLLGKCFLVARRHVEPVPALTDDEWHDLHGQIGITTGALQQAFQPDHFNYVFLQNQDRHAHLHIIPRYASARTFAGIEFEDPGYPNHYVVDVPEQRVTSEVRTHLAETIRERVEQIRTVR